MQFQTFPPKIEYTQNHFHPNSSRHLPINPARRFSLSLHSLELRRRPELLPAGRTDVVLPVPPGVLLLDVRIVIVLHRELLLAQPAPEDAVLVPLVLVPVPVGGERLDADRAQESTRRLVPLRVPQVVGLVQEHLVANLSRRNANEITANTSNTV